LPLFAALWRILSLMKIFAPLSAIVVLSLSRACWAAPVSVQVLGPDKKPVPGAQIRVRFWSDASAPRDAEPLQAVADAKGSAVFEAPPKPDAPARGGIGWVTAWSPDLAISSALLQQGGGVVSLEAGGVARGMVVDGEGRPVAGALVKLSGIDRAGDDVNYPYPVTSSKLDAEVVSARTDAEGRWSLSRVPLGAQVQIKLGDDKFALSSAFARAAADGAAFDWSAVEAAAREAASKPGFNPQAGGGRGVNADGALVARLGASISGRVVDPNGAPVVGAQVMARPQPQGIAYLLQTATTDAKGEFRIERLIAGDYGLAPSAPVPAKGQEKEKEIEWVAGEPLKASVGAGASVAAGDVKMIRGGVIEVHVLDEATGKGVAGVQAYAIPVPSEGLNSISSRTSDERGLLTLRAAPGKQKLMLLQPPADYLVPEHATYNDPTTVEVQAGATQSLVWKLKKGLTGSGRVLDEKGQPVPNLSINFRPSKEDWWGSVKSAQGDEAGKWSLGSFEPGVWKPYFQGAEWKVVGPKEVTFPHPGALDIIVAPIAKIAVGGKVVDGAGAPLPEAHVALKIQTVQENTGSQVERTATTAADGTWSVADVPEIAQNMTIEVSRLGYGVERAPLATKTQGTNTWAITEARLLKRDSRLGGQVLDAAGQPASEAQVLVAQATLAADKAGRWKLGELPAGEAEVVAVQANLSAVAMTSAPNESVTLKLKAPQVLAAREVERAQAVLDDAWQTSRGSKYQSRDSIPSALAVVDPDAALAMAQGEKKDEGLAVGKSVLAIVRVLAQQGDLDSAQSWATAHLAALSDPFEREQALLVLAQALPDADAAASKKWLGLARAGFANLKESWQQNLAAPRLAALASRLKEPDANALFEQALTRAKNATNGQSDFSGLASTVAPASEEWAVKVIEAAIAAAPTQPQYSEGPEAVVGSAIVSLAPLNLPGARRLLLKYGDLKNKNSPGSSWQMSRALAVVLGERARAGEDVDALSKEALELRQNQAQALALIAQNAPQARRAELLKRALDVAEKQSQFSLGDTLQVLARLLPLDREATKAGLERARAMLEAPRDPSNDYNRLRASDVANWAWLEQKFAPAAARLMIEREWALGLALPASDQDEWQRWPNMSKLVEALMPLDIERAQQLAERLPVAGYNAPAFGAQRAIALWMLASAEERASKPLSFWSRDIEHEGRYSDDW